MVMKSERTGEKFVRMYEKSLEMGVELPNLEEKLVLQYFQDNADNLPVEYDSPAEFHRAFRQIDVCKKGYQDMVIWSLMSGGKLNTIWKVLEEFYA